jgi:hypothetical protein
LAEQSFSDNFSWNYECSKFCGRLQTFHLTIELVCPTASDVFMIAKPETACLHNWGMQRHSHRKKIDDSVRFDASFKTITPIKPTMTTDHGRGPHTPDRLSNVTLYLSQTQLPVGFVPATSMLCPNFWTPVYDFQLLVAFYRVATSRTSRSSRTQGF